MHYGVRVCSVSLTLFTIRVCKRLVTLKLHNGLFERGRMNKEPYRSGEGRLSRESFLRCTFVSMLRDKKE